MIEFFSDFILHYVTLIVKFTFWGFALVIGFHIVGHLVYWFNKYIADPLLKRKDGSSPTQVSGLLEGVGMMTIMYIVIKIIKSIIG